jgi:hypothetical protein
VEKILKCKKSEPAALFFIKNYEPEVPLSQLLAFIIKNYEPEVPLLYL